MYVLNDPYHGGTHLPDITVITPVYVEGTAQPTFYVGSRGTMPMWAAPRRVDAAVLYAHRGRGADP